MILVDTKQIVYHIVYDLTRKFPGLPVQTNTVRPIFMQVIAAYNDKFSDTFGEMVLAVDAPGKPWRTDINEFYRYNRKKTQRTDLDMSAVRDAYSSIIKEIDEYLPLIVIKHKGVEADDIIGHLAIKNHKTERILVISMDHDFEQLLYRENVTLLKPKFFDFTNILNGVMFNSPKRFGGDIEYKKISKDDALDNFLTHVIKGDPGDGICNILSPINSLADKIRQKQIRAKSPDLLGELKNQVRTRTLPDDLQERFNQNYTLISFDRIPEQYTDIIGSIYTEQKEKTVKGILSYINDFNLKRLEPIKDYFRW